MRKRVLAVTMGDPGGIGPEIILKTLARETCPSIYKVVFGIPEVFEKASKTIQRSALGLNVLPAYNYEMLKKSCLNVVNVTGEAKRLFDRKCPASARSSKSDFQLVSGKVAISNACMSYASLEAAAHLAVLGMVDGIVTAPVNKSAMRLVEKNFHGHTEFLAEAAGVRKFAMMFVGPRLKVTLVTIHVPIRGVSRLIKKDRIYEKIDLTYRFLRDRMRIRQPKIAVCALNPHGKETGSEDEAEIVPAVQKAIRKGVKACGPYSADQIFFDAFEGRFDAVISMYHDQGLGPFKMIAFRDGVNVTLGLPFVRTSPDHGTAFDIAYQGKSDPASMISALKLAEQLVTEQV